jgi:hypothetical protein
MRLSVSVEDTTVVIKRQYIDSEFPGGTSEFARDAVNDADTA